MKNWILSVLVLLLGIGCKTTKPTAQAVSVDQDAVLADALLWKIEGNNLTKPSYMYGTFHIMCKEDITFSQDLEDGIKSTDFVYFEMDMNDPSNTMALIQAMNMKGGKTLKDLYTAEQYDRLEKHFKDKVGMSLKMFPSIKPFFLESFLYQGMIPCKKMSGVDMEIMELAKKAKKKIKGLETAAFQASIFDSIPYEEQAKMLYKNIDSMEKFQQEFTKMYNLYKDQKLTELLPMLENDEDGYAGFMDKLLDNRNRNWLQIMEKDLAENKSFFMAVGAAHLAGKYGLIKMLRKAGYSVTPMPLHKN